jgi:glyoxylate/hydroxypyruvate reductase A
MSILYRSDAPRAAAWASYFEKHAPDLDFRIWPEAGDLEQVEYLIAWQVPPDFLARLPRLKVLFSSGAGVDHVDLSAVPAHIPLVRMVEPGIINGMVEYVSLSALALHRDFFDYVAHQAARVWNPLEVPPASAAPSSNACPPMASGCAAGTGRRARSRACRPMPAPTSCSPSSPVATSSFACCR